MSSPPPQGPEGPKPTQSLNVATQDRVARLDLPPAAEREVQPGTQIDRFLITDKLGGGGMGVVYRATDPTLDRSVALKLLHPGRRQKGADGVARLLREARTVARLTHPNIVSVYECGQYEGGVYIAMELVEGDTIRRWNQRRHPSVPELLDVLVSAGRGLIAAHAQGLVHRDVKPANILVTAEGKAKVVDFGLAREVSQISLSGSSPRVDEDDNDSDRLTRDGVLVGTPGYMPAEYFDRGIVGPSVDQFAFCVTGYELFYGEKPFGRSQRKSVRENIREGNVRPPPEGTHVPARVRRILLRGLASDPQARYPSMRELVADFERVRRRRRRLLTGAGLVATVAASVVLGRVALAPSVADPCPDEARALATSLQVGVDAGAQHLSALDDPSSERARDRVESTLGPWSTAWVERRTDACGKGPDAGSEAERQLVQLCLDAQARDVGVLLETIATADLEAARFLVTSDLELPRSSDCQDLATLGMRPPIPVDAGAREAVEAVGVATAEISAQLSLGRFAAARARADELAQALPTVEHAPTRAAYAQEAARLELAVGDHQAAIALLKDAVPFAERARDPGLKAALWLLLAKAYAWTGRAGAASVALDAAAAAETDATTQLLLARAEVAILADERELATSLYQQVLQADLSDWDREDALLALGDVTYGLQNASIAAQWHRESLALREANHGVEHPRVGEALSALGRVLKSVDLNEAEQVLLRALEIQERAYGEDGLPVAVTLERLASVLTRKGRSGEALQKLRRAVEIIEAHPGRAEFNTSIVWSRLGSALSAQGQHAEALQAHAEAFGRFEIAFGPTHPRLGLPAMNYAFAARRAGKLLDAAVWFDRALELLPSRPSRAKQRAVLRFELARVLWESGQDTARARVEAREALEAFDPADDLYDGVDYKQIADWLAQREADPSR